MIPLKDKTIRRRFPYVNVSLLVLNLAIFLFEWSLPGPLLEALVFQYGFVPVRFFSGEGFGMERFYPLLTSMFLHGGWLHLGSNMLTLWVFGDNVEDRMGHIVYLLFYLVSGVIAALAHGLLLINSPIPTVGASGAIAGVLGAYMLLFPRARVVTLIPLFIFFFVSEISAIFFIGIWFIAQLFSGIAALGPMMAETGVAWWAHVGGFVAGLVFAMFLGGPERPYLPRDEQYRGY
ncbi:MAG: rhomboid family intramembrane serine protease [Chloroflexota bacterium]|nr:rhomboid family intramembrane serine protease [Chloroflexota bacterium]